MGRPWNDRSFLKPPSVEVKDFGLNPTDAVGGSLARVLAGDESVAQGESASPGYARTARGARVLAGDSDDPKGWKHAQIL